MSRLASTVMGKLSLSSEYRSLQTRLAHRDLNFIQQQLENEWHMLDFAASSVV
jgi:hypothetical protein